MTHRRLALGLFLAIAASSGFAAPPETTPKQKKFDTPEQASEALIAAATDFDADELTSILGPDGVDLVVTSDPVLDENQAHAFAAAAREAHHVARDEKRPKTATLIVGDENWPLPIPIIKEGTKWRFDTKSGRQEILFRRIGENELDAIEVCRGYVEAQDEYASERRDGSTLNQYAQRVISTPGRQDGLAWQAKDGTWEGPVGEAIARVIAEGYTEGISPYHGYYFKILTAQGPHAPLGSMSFMVRDIMIGGFALVAAPAEYRVTGVKTFIVGTEGIVYEKDVGTETYKVFKEMTQFDPDPSWDVVLAEE